MTEAEQVENLIIGSGEAGKWMAWELGRAGQQTVVVERKWIGGSCPNINCLPSKNEIHSARVAHLVRNAAAFGTDVTGARTNMPNVVGRKRKMVEEEIAGHLALYRRAGTELVLGDARFVAPKTVEVKRKDGGTRLYRGERVFLNLGTRPALPPIPGLAGAAMTNIELLELDQLPEHLMVLGGGYVGVEFAQAYRRFGSRVTIVERGSQLLAHEDPDVAHAVSQLLSDEGVDVLLDTTTVSVEGARGDWRIVVRANDGEHAGESSIAGSHVLAAMGRKPNTEGIGLDVAGIEVDARGYIAVNDRLETSAPGTWAMGECAGSPQFTHVAFDDFRIVHANLFGGNRSARGRIVPFCLFTDPELARVGMNETEARRRGLAVRVASLPMQNVLRTETTGETRGFMKALIDVRRDDILGFTIFGADAGEVASVVQTAMVAGLPYTSLRDMILAHPTMAEGLNVLFRQPLQLVESAQRAQSPGLQPVA
jgi:pyruvate/2-oxoglutarate dehydrogenase complex dihydrolipoamide dehydrogenase (E3) component